MSSLVDRARMTVSSTGPGTLTLGSAVSGFQSFAAAGVVNGDVGIEYLIEDGVSAWEIGTGTYTSAGTTLSRTLRSSSTGSLLAVSTNAIVSIIPTANTIASRAPIASPTFTGTVTAPTVAISGGAINNTTIGATTPSTGNFTTLTTTSTASVAGNGITYSTLGAGHYHGLRWDNTYEHIYVDGSDVGRIALFDTSGNLVTPGLGAITAAGSISAGSGFALNQSSIGGYWSADPTYGIFSFSGGWRWLWQRSNGNLFWQNTSGTNLLTVANDGSVTANGSVTATAAVNAMSDLYFGFSQQSTTRLQSFGNTWYWAWNTANGDLSWNGGGTSRWVMRVSDGLAYNNMNAVAGYGAYINLSDASVKTDIADASHGLQQILQLQPKTFRRKARSNDFEHDLELGFVAQDVQAVLPHAVRQANFADEPLLGLTLDPIVAALVNSVKTMAAQIAELKAARA